MFLYDLQWKIILKISALTSNIHLFHEYLITDFQKLKLPDLSFPYAPDCPKTN
jgi:hypothetical protein